MISIVYTNSAYSDVFAVFLSQYRKYSSIPLRKISDEHADHIYSNDEPYYKHWLQALNSIQEDYFIYNQDDFFLYGAVDSQKLRQLTEILDDTHWSYIRLIKSGRNLSTRKPDVGLDHLYMVGEESSPQFSMQATLWKKRVFMQLYEEAAQTLWYECPEYEIVCRQLGIAGLYYYAGEPQRGRHHYDSSIYPYVATAIVGGKWNLSEYAHELCPILSENRIDPCDRGIYL